MATKGGVPAHRVTWRIAQGLLEGARRAELPIAPLLEGLPFDAASLRAMRWVSWDDYCTIVERVETACGGPEKVEWFMLDNLPYEEMKGIAGAFVDARTYFRLTMTVIARMSFPTLEVSYTELDDRKLAVGYRIREGARACIAFQRLSLGAYRALPRYLGLPAARIEATYDDRSFEGVVWLPESRTVLARVKRRARSNFGLVVDFLRTVVDETSDAPIARAANDEQPRERFARFKRAHGLTARQAEVVEGLVGGASNKELAENFGCTVNTIEVHASEIYRRVGVKSRAQLISHFWRS